MEFARKLQLESQLHSTSLPVEYVNNYSGRLSNIDESPEDAENDLQCQSFEHIVNNEDIY